MWKNPRRFWMQGHLQVVLVGEPAEFPGLTFNCVAKMSMPPEFDPALGQSSLENMCQDYDPDVFNHDPWE